jgi:hypothetical protein
MEYSEKRFARGDIIKRLREDENLSWEEIADRTPCLKKKQKMSPATAYSLYKEHNLHLRGGVRLRQKIVDKPEPPRFKFWGIPFIKKGE